MDNKIKTPCRHKYIVGYSLRTPQPFFRSLLCDNCSCRIKLSTPWRALYVCAYFIGWIVAFEVASSIHIRLFENTFIVSLAIFVVLCLVVEQLNRLILRYAKWVEA